MKKMIGILLCVLASMSIWAENVRVSGVVNDVSGPLIGASVIEKGTTNGTVTDLDGHFDLSV